VEWDENDIGNEYYNGSGQTVGGKRLLFMAGTQDDPYTDIIGDDMPVGVFNLNPQGEQMSHNAIEYMLTKSTPKIILVTETVDRDGDTFQDDQEWIDKLANKYDLDVRPDYWMELDSNYVNELNDSDLVIISRTASSVGYANDLDEVEAWASVTTPIICLSAWHVRSNRLQWIESGTVNRTLDAYMLTHNNSDTHQIFDNITFDGYNVGNSDKYLEMVFISGFAAGYMGNCVIADTDVGQYGTLIGKTSNNETFIAEWPKDKKAYDNSDVVQAGARFEWAIIIG
jgi:hypothetical protein